MHDNTGPIYKLDTSSPKAVRPRSIRDFKAEYPRFKEVLGYGSYGLAVHAIDRHGHDVVVKIQVANSPTAMQWVDREIVVQQILTRSLRNHRNYLRGQPQPVAELMDYGTISGPFADFLTGYDPKTDIDFDLIAFKHMLTHVIGDLKERTDVLYHYERDQHFLMHNVALAYRIIIMDYAHYGMPNGSEPTKLVSNPKTLCHVLMGLDALGSALRFTHFDLSLANVVQAQYTIPKRKGVQQPRVEFVRTLSDGSGITIHCPFDTGDDSDATGPVWKYKYAKMIDFGDSGMSFTCGSSEAPRPIRIEGGSIWDNKEKGVDAASSLYRYNVAADLWRLAANLFWKLKPSDLSGDQPNILRDNIFDLLAHLVCGKSDAYLEVLSKGVAKMRELKLSGWLTLDSYVYLGRKLMKFCKDRETRNYPDIDKTIKEAKSLYYFVPPAAIGGPTAASVLRGANVFAAYRTNPGVRVRSVVYFTIDATPCEPDTSAEKRMLRGQEAAATEKKRMAVETSSSSSSSSPSSSDSSPLPQPSLLHFNE